MKKITPETTIRKNYIPTDVGQAKLVVYLPILIDKVIYWYDDNEKGRKGWNYNFGLNKLDNLPYLYESHSTEWNFCRKIVAQSENILDGVPVISIEKDWYTILRSTFGLSSDQASDISDYILKNTYQYSQKDIDNTINLTVDKCNDLLKETYGELLVNNDSIISDVNIVKQIVVDNNFNILDLN